jgi:hypothetical protein
VIKPWKPRCSSLGVYAKCLWRAANDRRVAEGLQPPPPPQANTSNASLGTCEHFVLQDGIRCQFPAKILPVDPLALFDKVEALERANRPLDVTNLTPKERELLQVADEQFDGDLAAAHTAWAKGDPRCYAPTKAEWADASQLWRGNLDHCREQARATASLAAARVPALPNGETWLAEEEFENDYTCGHTDFRRRDNSVLGDLKTTGKPPQGGWLKHDHLWQLTGYHLLTGAPKAWVLYVDSMHAKWVNVVWIDFTTDAMKFFAEQVEAFCRFTMSDRLWDAAYPNIGDHCVHSWCNYRAECYQKIMPPPGSLYNVSIARKAVGPIRLVHI